VHRKNAMPPNEKRTESEVSCEAVLSTLIELARAVLGDEGGAAKSSAPSKAVTPERGPGASAAQQRLLQALLGLQPEMAIKVRTLMVAGRDSQDISAKMQSRRLPLRLAT
jgi:hypothetical protein